MTNHIPQSYLDIIEANKDHVCPPENSHFCVDLVSAAKLPSRYGNFIAIAFDQTADQKEHAAFVKGDVYGKENVLVRMHSECLTGDAIGSLRGLPVGLQRAFTPNGDFRPIDKPVAASLVRVRLRYDRPRFPRGSLRCS